MTTLLLALSLAHGQAYEAQPCTATADLAAQLAAGQVKVMTPRGPRFAMVSASSLLPPPESAKPDLEAARKLAERERIEVGEPEHGLPQVAADVLSCTYGPTQVLDGDPATAWCEAADGPGVDQVLVLQLPADGALTIHNGYGKSAERFAQNARIHDIEVVLLGQGIRQPVQGTLHTDLPVLGRHEVRLKDLNEPQELPLPEVGPPADWNPDLPEHLEAPPAQEPAFVALRILSTFPGSRWQDTCISEIAGAP